MRKFVLFCSIVYFEIILVIILLIFFLNVYNDAKNIFKDYLYVKSSNDLILANKNKYNAVTIKGTILETGKALAETDGKIDKIYYVIELEDSYILLGVSKHQIDNYELNKVNKIHAKIKPLRAIDDDDIKEIEKNLNLKKDINRVFELVIFSIHERRVFLLILVIIACMIIIEAFIRGNKKLKKYYHGKK